MGRRRAGLSCSSRATAGVEAPKPTARLLGETITRGARGGPIVPADLPAQQRRHPHARSDAGRHVRLAELVRTALARLGAAPAITAARVRLARSLTNANSHSRR